MHLTLGLRWTGFDPFFFISKIILPQAGIIPACGSLLFYRYYKVPVTEIKNHGTP